VSLAGGVAQPVVLAKGTQVDAQPAAGGFNVDPTVDGVALRGIFVPSAQAARPIDFAYARLLTLFRCNLNGTDCALALVQDYDDNGFDSTVHSTHGEPHGRSPVYGGAVKVQPAPLLECPCWSVPGEGGREAELLAVLTKKILYYTV
jgi:hypothetical protein